MDETGLLAAPRLSPGALLEREIPRVIRGYDVHVTDTLLQEASAEIQALLDQNAELQAECERLAQMPVPGGPDAGEQAARILMAAQRQREQLLGQTQEYARQVGSDAETRRRRLLAEARERADRLSQATIEEATRKAADIIAQAPMAAQERLTTVRALTGAWEANLRSFATSLVASLDALNEAQEHPLDTQAGNGQHEPAPA